MFHFRTKVLSENISESNGGVGTVGEYGIYSFTAHKYEKNVKRKVKYPSTKSLSCGPLSIEVTVVAGGLEWPCIEPVFFLTIVAAILHKLAACAASQFNFFVHTISTVIGRVIIVRGISKNETVQ